MFQEIHPHHHKPFLPLRIPHTQPPEQRPKCLKIRQLETRSKPSDPILAPALALPVLHTFEDWLNSDLGREVQHRIHNNRHSVLLDRVASHFDTAEDVQQKALIWLWQMFQTDPMFSRFQGESLSHQAGILTKVAVRGGRCVYAKRRIEGREQQTSLETSFGQDKLSVVLMGDTAIRATDVRDHDRGVVTVDQWNDIHQAIERVVAHMVCQYAISAGNRRKVPIERITRTLIEIGRAHV